ncbi:MAG: hypothetical protein H0V56_12055, partial [Chthoniobacterales bacterium]|nr:hypothetical protein [Chthoniobacterales bacterium]
DTSPLVLLRDEVKALLRDLRVTVKAYAQRLEGDLQRSARVLDAAGPADELSREQLHEFREAMMLVRKRKLKPQNGRRKDLRKIDSIIGDLQLLVQSGSSRAD